MFHGIMAVWMLLALIWFAWSILPILPWAVFSLAGMLVVEFWTSIDFSMTTWIIVIVLILFAIISDYIFPLIWAKYWGGTKAWTRWWILGMLGWFFFAPRWLILWPILGAFLGEYMIKQDKKQARRAALWSLLWSTASTVVKLIAAWFVVYYILMAWIGG